MSEEDNTHNPTDQDDTQDLFLYTSPNNQAQSAFNVEQEFDQAFVIQPPDKEDLPGDNVIKESPGPPLDNTVPLSDSTENTAGDKTANIPNIFLSDYTDPAINNTKNTNTATKSAQIITTLV